MDFLVFFFAFVAMAALGCVLASILAFANRSLRVEEDPRIENVEDLLPGANCGACGLPGCRSFAEAVVSGSLSPAKCTVSSPDNVKTIAQLLGVAVGNVEKRVARLACAGGNNVARQRARYEGLETCQAADLVGGGGKGCAWGCLGFGDCETACTFQAISMSAQGLPEVEDERCTACGDCVDICPRDLFSIQSVAHRLWVACKSAAAGEEALEECEVACTACGRCAADAPEGLIEIKNNLAVVDYSKNALASEVALQRCPTGAIVWIGERKEWKKGREAKRVYRSAPLPLG